jgi:hypothetical protein
MMAFSSTEHKKGHPEVAFASLADGQIPQYATVGVTVFCENPG